MTCLMVGSLFLLSYSFRLYLSTVTLYYISPNEIFRKECDGYLKLYVFQGST